MSASQLPYALYRAEQVRQLDELAINLGKVPGIQLMKRAGRAAFSLLRTTWPDCECVVVLCGGGNNGGDGYVIAALAAQKGMAVQVLSACDPAQLKGDAYRAYCYAAQEGVLVVEVDDWSAHKKTVAQAHVLVDALLGTGLKGEVRTHYQQAIALLNSASAPILAMDIPSGLCSDSGAVLGTAVKATSTMTFVAFKQGLLTGRAPAYVGCVVFNDLQLSELQQDPLVAGAMAAIEPSAQRVDTVHCKKVLPLREADAHKGMFGHVMVIGGDKGFGGAVAMAAQSCARAGAGLTSAATQPEHVLALLARVPEVMVNGVASGQALEPLLSKPSVIVIGPGLGRSPWSEQMLQQAVVTGTSLVVDADALNILSQGRVVSKAYRQNWVLTPHPGEAARLLGCSIACIQADRFGAVQKLQRRYGGVAVLKGAGTLIADGERVYVANVGNPGMASGGMGDVLSGVIGALVAQGLSLCEAACLAVCLHGDAADLALAEGGARGMLATDLIPYIRELLN